MGVHLVDDPRARPAGYSSTVYVRPALEAPIELTARGFRHRYEILGVVETAMSATSGIVPTARLMARLQDQALAWVADAVIGIRLSQFTLPGASQVFRGGV